MKLKYFQVLKFQLFCFQVLSRILDTCANPVWTHLPDPIILKSKVPVIKNKKITILKPTKTYHITKQFILSIIVSYEDMVLSSSFRKFSVPGKCNNKFLVFSSSRIIFGIATCSMHNLIRTVQSLNHSFTEPTKKK